MLYSACLQLISGIIFTARNPNKTNCPLVFVSRPLPVAPSNASTRPASGIDHTPPPPTTPPPPLHRIFVLSFVVGGLLVPPPPFLFSSGPPPPRRFPSSQPFLSGGGVVRTGGGLDRFVGGWMWVHQCLSLTIEKSNHNCFVGWWGGGGGPPPPRPPLPFCLVLFMLGALQLFCRSFCIFIVLVPRSAVCGLGLCAFFFHASHSKSFLFFCFSFVFLF